MNDGEMMLTDELLDFTVYKSDGERKSCCAYHFVRKNSLFWGRVMAYSKTVFMMCLRWDV